MYLQRGRGCRILALLITLVVFWIFYFGYLCLDEICTDENSDVLNVPISHRHVTQLNVLRLKESHDVDFNHLRHHKEQNAIGSLSTRIGLLNHVSTIGINSHSEPQSNSITFKGGSESRDALRTKLKARPPSRQLENVDISSEDVLVFLHIQKTGGTSFGKHLVKNLDIAHPCLCRSERIRCDCYTPHSHIWLFSRFSTGWACGLHADWTELTSCVDHMLNRKEIHVHPPAKAYRYLYITILREPVSRYLSEWKHVQRGATWMTAKLRCNGRQATLQEVPFCFEGEDWSGVSLDDFMKCDSNLAINRQVRMLANLSLVHCYNKSAMSAEDRNSMLLQSAKDNLAGMAFFGLTEFQKETQYLFEKTFKLKFIDDFEQKNETTASRTDISTLDYERVKKSNRLDIELYNYAKELFFQRLKLQQQEDRERNTDITTGDNFGR